MKNRWLRFIITVSGALAGGSCGESMQVAGSTAQPAAPSAEARAPMVSINVASVSFEAQTVGTASSPQTVIVSNSGTAALTISNVSLGGADAAAFAQSNTCGSPIAPGKSCTVTFTFDPVSAGSKSAMASISSDAAANPSIALIGSAALAAPQVDASRRPPFAPYAPSDPRVLLDVGIAALKPRNSWTALPSGFSLDRVPGRTAGTISDTTGFTPNSGGYIVNYAAFPSVASSQGTVYIRVQRRALAVDDSTDSGTTFFDSTGSTHGGYGANAATLFTLYDGANNIVQWVMSPQATSAQILDAGTWLYPGVRYANSHGSANLDPAYTEVVLTWQGTTYWAYFDGVPVAYGTFAAALPATGLFSQMVIGGYLGGAGSVGQPLGPFSIQRFQLSTAFTAPPVLTGQPLIAFYGDSFVVQGGGVSGNVAGPPGSPSIGQVAAVQSQLDPTTSPNASAGTIGQDGFVSRAQAYALKKYGGYLKFFTAAESGHGWAYTGMGGTTMGNTPAIDDFSLGKTGYSDALDATQPAYIFAFGSVNDVNNGVPADIVGDVKTHFDYWANHNPNLKAIYYVETLSWELATGACTARGGPVGWKAEMGRQRGLLRTAFGGGYRAGARGVPVTYVKTYETWVQGPNSRRFLFASNPDNKTQSSNTGNSPNGHPDAEGNIQMVDAYVWPYLTQLLH